MFSHDEVQKNTGPKKYKSKKIQVQKTLVENYTKRLHQLMQCEKATHFNR